MDTTSNLYNSLILLAQSSSKYCVGMEGNISAKTDYGMIIKASGSKLSDLKTEDLVEFDSYGNQTTNYDKRGSMELGFHRFLLGFEDINYVSHTHPTNTVKILCTNLANTFATNRLFPDQVIFNSKKSCLVPYAKPGNDLTEIIKKTIKIFINSEGYFPALILLKNHGIITCGKTIDECIIANDICEKSAKIFIGAMSLNKINFLTNNEIIELIEDKNEKYRKGLI